MSFTESEIRENLISSFERFSQKDFEMSEPFSVPSSQKGFENSKQNDTNTSVRKVEQNIVQNTVPQSFPCPRSGRPPKPPLRFQNYVNLDGVDECLLSEDIDYILNFNEECYLLKKRIGSGQ